MFTAYLSPVLISVCSKVPRIRSVPALFRGENQVKVKSCALWCWQLFIQGSLQSQCSARAPNLRPIYLTNRLIDSVNSNFLADGPNWDPRQAVVLFTKQGRNGKLGLCTQYLVCNLSSDRTLVGVMLIALCGNRRLRARSSIKVISKSKTSHVST